MITLFRRIREKLIASGSVTKYLLYAVGEILLVVIGILIALQVSNWNQESVTRKLEIDSLKEMKQNLEQDTLILSVFLDQLNDKKEYNREIIEHIENKRPYEVRLDTLQMEVYYHRGYDTFNTAAYELLKERGFDIIQNDELRKRITAHYTSDLSDIRGIIERLEKINLLRAEGMYENFKVFPGSIRPYDYEEALNDPKVYGPFYHFQSMNRHYYDVLEEFKLKTASLLEALNAELNRRSV
ncbi:DUF6090 family protein [Balneola sp. MJW-20]|uniref:DUF6090 family protein n=1 Tax=Gracilimonas aurantiaca TaxID=3234185 RepID=UPI003467ACA8